MVNVADVKARIDDWVGIGYSYGDAVGVVCDAERMKIGDEYNEYNEKGIIKYNGRLGRECRELEGLRYILLEGNKK